MAARVPGFGLALARSVAKRLQRALHRLPLPDHLADAAVPEAEVVGLLPRELVLRHRVVLSSSTGDAHPRVVDAPSAAVLDSVRTQVPGPSSPGPDRKRLLRIHPGRQRKRPPRRRPPPSKPSTLDPWLEAMGGRGVGFTLAGQQPKWRIDGSIRNRRAGLGPTTALT